MIAALAIVHVERAMLLRVIRTTLPGEFSISCPPCKAWEAEETTCRGARREERGNICSLCSTIPFLTGDV
jgi:hypothetical protein